MFKIERLQKIKTAFERQKRAVSLRPYIGKGTAVTKLKFQEGLACEIEEGQWKFMVDMNEKWGGDGAGPTAGTYGRGAFAGCLAIGYLTYAAKYDIEIDNLEIEVHADYDTRGYCDVDGMTSKYLEIRYIVSLETTATEEEIIRVLDEAEKHSTYFEIFRDSLKLKRILRINETEYA